MIHYFVVYENSLIISQIQNGAGTWYLHNYGSNFIIGLMQSLYLWSLNHKKASKHLGEVNIFDIIFY